MTNPEIIFDKNFPETFKLPLEVLLKETIWLLPLWVQRLRVGWNGEEGIIATMETHKDYRYCRLTIHPEFTTYPAEYQRQTLYHEIFHAYNTPAVDYAAEIIKMLCEKLENPELEEVCTKELSRKMEASTEDFSYRIAAKIGEMVDAD